MISYRTKCFCSNFSVAFSLSLTHTLSPSLASLLTHWKPQLTANCWKSAYKIEHCGNMMEHLNWYVCAKNRKLQITVSWLLCNSMFFFEFYCCEFLLLLLFELKIQKIMKSTENNRNKWTVLFSLLIVLCNCRLFSASTAHTHTLDRSQWCIRLCVCCFQMQFDLSACNLKINQARMNLQMEREVKENNRLLYAMPIDAFGHTIDG